VIKSEHAMRRCAWVTDIHLNFVGPSAVEGFCRSIGDLGPDVVLVGGDIGEAPSITTYLQILEDRLRRPIYFVLGNHDFYRGSLACVRRDVDELARGSRWLRWLPTAGIIPLTHSTCLIGHDTWADGRFGDYANSDVILNDYLRIAELTGLEQTRRLAMLNSLGDEAAAYLRTLLPEALATCRHVVVLVHVPPFREACWHEGRISGDDFLPHFSCKAVGEVLVEAMRARPDTRMTVLCGHTHSPGTVQILANLVVHTGGALYGHPEIQKVLVL